MANSTIKKPLTLKKNAIAASASATITNVSEGSLIFVTRSDKGLAVQGIIDYYGYAPIQSHANISLTYNSGSLTITNNGNYTVVYYIYLL